MEEGYFEQGKSLITAQEFSHQAADISDNPFGKGARRNASTVKLCNSFNLPKHNAQKTQALLNHITHVEY